MRLHSVTFSNYRRFRDTSTLVIDDPIVALVGPNEAGKTSILNAIARIGAKNGFTAADVSQSALESGPLFSAKFLLEPDDLEAIAEIPHTDTPKWLTFSHRIGRRTFDLSPMPGRVDDELKSTQAVIESLLTRLKDTGDPLRGSLASLQGELSRIDDRRTRPFSETKLAALDTVLGFIGVALHKNPEVFLTSDAAESFSRDNSHGVRVMRRESYPASTLRRLGKDLSSLRSSLAGATPAASILQALIPLVPEFIQFTEEDRRLPGSFDLTQDDLPRGLASLLRLAKLNLHELREAVLEDRHLKIAELMDQANIALKEEFQAWRQDTVWPNLYVSGNFIYIMVRAAHGNTYSDWSERSEGFRQFIALVACVNSARRADGGKGAKDAIVLIDEAENHLHYDAQADLIDVFTKQRLVKQIIYSTHSAGCLPEDLGTGVRAIQPNPGTPTSVIKNWFWDGGAGFSPLLISMGAASLAFASVRRVVLTEGPSDMLLLPSLIREATGLPSLGYQIAPGLSEISPRLTQQLDLEAARSCFLVDGDAGGAALSRKLQEGGVPADRVLFLGGEKSGLMLEDLICESVYLACINELLGVSEVDRVPDSFELPLGGRTEAIKSWCEERSLSVPGKRLVAQVVARKARDASVLAPEHTAMLRDLHDAIEVLLN
ncbi:AAA family ATPase [Streptomyces griseus]|uniref:AAA family ATPase n=1 Tax=Streptomyces griseus TaxID=1911 RepID=UPI00386A1D40|nr:AAA family ATPase [Streptomyces griseus]WTD67068.1 AAA family ATPase [Streptomyces griseus]